MGKTLIIAEKPSVMTDLSRVLTKVLGKFEKHGSGRDIFFENDSAVITSAVGHLVELRMPMGPNGKKLPWNFGVLPAIPEKFELDPIPDSEARLKQVLKLAKRKDVDLIVNACDAGREGELIFRYIMEIGGVDKPVKRLWMQSMTNDSILEAWKNLRPGEQMKPLADAAKPFTFMFICDGCRCITFVGGGSKLHTTGTGPIEVAKSTSNLPYIVAPLLRGGGGGLPPGA